MLAYHLELQDETLLEKVKAFLQTLPAGKVKLTPENSDTIADKYTIEIAKRLADIDAKKEILTPYDEGMNEMMDRVRSKYAH
ncbi:MAG: hypothetical protein NT103_06030 [Campylobacterales bacterium]|nr:hypothetical protein [Campylobacterales bacterium]